MEVDDNYSNSTIGSVGGRVDSPEGLTVFSKITISFQLILMVFIIGANVLVLAALCRFHSLRDITGIFVANLAVADLITGLAMPFQAAFLFYPQMDKDKHLCLLRYLVITFACNASIYSLVCTVIDRLIAISFPLHYTRIMTQTKALVLILGIWVLDIVIQSIPLLGVNDWDTAPICLFEIVMDKWYRLFVFSSGIFFAFLMLMIYIRIFCIVRRHVLKIKSEISTTWGQQNPGNAKHMNTVIAIVVLFFQISWLPFFITELTMLNGAVTQTKVIIANFCVFLGLSNALMNPLIYAWKNKQYRRAFKKLLGMKIERNGDTTVSTIGD